MWQKKTLFILLLVFLSLCSVVYGFLHINFYPQSNPFNITYTDASNKTYYIRFPMEARYNNISLELTGFNIGAYIYDLSGTSLYHYTPGSSWYLSPTYDGYKAFDGDYDTCALENGGGTSKNGTVSGTFFLKDGYSNNLVNIQHTAIACGVEYPTKVNRNFTIPSDCINSSNAVVLNLTIRTHFADNSGSIWLNCYNFTGNKAASIYSNVSTTSANYVKEVSLYQNLSGYPTKVGAFFNGAQFFYKSDTLETTVRASIPPSTVNTILSAGCVCANCTIIDNYCRLPIKYYSDTGGILEVGLYNDSYYKQACLIDEKDNTLFNIENVTSARVYADDNSSYFDYKVLDKNCTNLTITDNNLRFEFTYTDGGVITRYIDTDLVPYDLRVCINKQGVTHYEQLIQSSTEREALLRSIFADCYVAADYTRFGYQTSYLLKAFTIATQYDLSVYEDGEQIRLSGIDGSIQDSYINIDTIQISQTQYDLNILDDSLAFELIGNSTLRLDYLNKGAANTAVTVTIYRMDTGASVYSTSSFTDLDDWTLYYYFLSLPDINATTMFKVAVAKTNAQGTSTINRYVNTFARSGMIPAGIAITIAFLMTIFGLTFTTARLSLSWFGIFAIILSLLVLSFAVSAWYITFFMYVDLVAIVFCFIVMTMQNKSTLVN